MSSIFLFPGQGSQFVGMGSDLFNAHSSVKSLYNNASDILGFDIAKISFEGPDSDLKQTQFTQPAIFVHSVAVDMLLKEKGYSPYATAGHSLGEFSALVSANVLQFEDALQIVKVRSQEMAKAGDVQPGSMAAIIGASNEQINEICNQNGIVVPANLNAPGQVVLSGEVDAVKSAIEAAKSIGIRRAIPLNVSGAFHSPLMTPAREPLSKIINNIKFNTSTIPVYQNVSAKAVTDTTVIKENMLKQLESPVLWETTISNMILDDFANFVEVGPGKVLNGLNRRINREISTQSVGTIEQLNAITIN
jgi:[acyl-carrier-protein] S-malonyltransferase